jgi:hypothetical protein
MKRYIDGNLHGSDITDMENQEKFLTNQLKQLQTELDGLAKVEAE